MKSDAADVLVVDLDGTLLQSDMLFESFWSAFGRNWRSPILSLIALTKGKASLKRYLAEASVIDAVTLPYDPDVLAYIEQWRKNGGRAVLVTATDQSLRTKLQITLASLTRCMGPTGKTI